MDERIDYDALIKATVKLFLCCHGRFIPWEAMSHKRAVTSFCHVESWLSVKGKEEGKRENLNFSDLQIKFQAKYIQKLRIMEIISLKFLPFQNDVFHPFEEPCCILQFLKI